MTYHVDWREKVDGVYSHRWVKVQGWKNVENVLKDLQGKNTTVETWVTDNEAYMVCEWKRGR